MQAAQKRNREAMPVGDLGIVALQSSEVLGQKVNDYIVQWRKDRDHKHSGTPQLHAYARDSYLIRNTTPRFGSGEGKAREAGEDGVTGAERGHGDRAGDVCSAGC